MAKENTNKSDLPEAISDLSEKELTKIVPSLKPQDAKKITRYLVQKSEITTQIHSGPMPSPEVMAGYEKIKKGFAERIVRMAEKEQDHRHSFYDSLLRNEKLLGLAGIASGFIIALVALIGGFIITLKGFNGVGYAAIIGSLASLVAVFIYGKIQNNKNSTDK